MIRTERHGDVTRFELSNRRSRMAGVAVSVYLVRGILVDAGFPSVGDEVARLLNDARLRGVMLTHWHEDHAGNVEAVARRAIPIAAHPGTLDVARCPRPLPLYRRFMWGEPTPLVSPAVSFDPAPLEMIHTPGHSADHQVVWDAETRTLFSGDLFLGVKVRVAHASERPRALAASLRRLLALEPLRVFDSHRGLIPNGAQALEAKLAWVEATIDRVETMARAGTPARTIERVVLGPRDLNDFISGGEYSRANLVRAILDEGAAAR